MNQASNQVTETAHFHDHIRDAIVAARHSAVQVGLLLIGFEGGVKDSPGQDLFEKASTLIGSALSDCDAIICKVAGTEVAVLLSSLKNLEDATLVVQKLLYSLEQLFPRDGAAAMHIGIAMYPSHGSSAYALLECAYVALNSARGGKTKYSIFAPERGPAPRPPLRLSELRQAIVQDELFMLYQPKIDLRNGSVTGLEALTRWRHPEYGLIMPDEFIPLAERTGLIIPLTLWALNQSLTQFRRWRSQGIHINIALNLSMWNLDTVELPEQVSTLLASVGMPPSQLELEITESAIMDDPQRAIRTLKATRELGVRFTIDDFGTGYSSLAQLKRLPVNAIKIDKSFIQNMEGDRDSAVIVRAIIDLGHNLGLNVVAEGVETLEAKEMLTDFNCDEAQGYYFSRPVSAADITRYIRKREAESTNQECAVHLSSPLSAELTSDISATIKSL